MVRLANLHKRLMGVALSRPQAYEDHPWGETVVKVKAKIFVFFGEEPWSRIGVKLPYSGDFALQHSDAEPSGYGLGKHGWVTVFLDRDRPPDADLLTDWIVESYRAVAPKRLVLEVDQV